MKILKVFSTDGKFPMKGIAHQYDIIRRKQAT
jgi:hypothetical protein